MVRLAVESVYLLLLHLFSSHGTLPWTAAHERRTLFFRYVASQRAGLPIPKQEEERVKFVVSGDT